MAVDLAALRCPARPGGQFPMVGPPLRLRPGPARANGQDASGLGAYVDYLLAWC